MAELKYKKIDWVIVGLYLALILFGWMNIYSSSVGEEGFVFSFKQKYIMDLVWMATALFIGSLILFLVPPKIYPAVAWPCYILMVVLLIAVAFIGVEVNGSKSWFALGPFRLQPAEFSKITTSVLLALLMSRHDFRFGNWRDALRVAAVLAIPMLSIVLEKETGSALVYLGFLLVFYREGMTGWILLFGLAAVFFFILTLVLSPFVAVLVLVGIIGVAGGVYARKLPVALGATTAVILLLAFFPRLSRVESLAFLQKLPMEIWAALLTGIPAVVLLVVSLLRRNSRLRNLMLCFLIGLALILSVDIAFQTFLKGYQRDRIEVLLGIKEDPAGVGYNVHQSLVAIGSGGLAGKGYLGGTQTRFDFVPEQSTDFIFCTIGEEWGFLGTMAVLGVYLALILRLIGTAEKQSNRFTRIYGWCVAACLLMHVTINVCMTIGLMPVIGIPLPLLSYGGSSLWAFTILIFIYLRLDLEKWRYR